MANEEWKTLPVDKIKADSHNAISIGPFGSRMKAELYRPYGIPVIRGNNLSTSKKFVKDFVFVSEETASRLQTSVVFPNDLVFPHRGAIGEVGIVPDNGPKKFILSSSLMKLTCNTKLVDPLFLFYFFRSSLGRQELLKNASTVGTPGIATPLNSLRSIEVPVPPLIEQQNIACILGTLDDKIELNREMNETLEAMARAIFKSWFVDFDPVRAKAGGRDTGLPPDVAALFPSDMVKVDGREVPKGWGVETIGKSATIVGGSTPSTKNPSFWDNGTHPFATPKDLAGLSTPILSDTEKKITDVGVDQISSRVLPVGTVLLSSRAPIGYIALTTIPVSINQGFVAIICDKILPNYYILSWVRENLPAIIDRANGTTFLEISKLNFRPMEIITPSPEVLEKFVELVKPLYAKIENNEQQSHMLTEIRDALLPKLMSGEINVSQVNGIVREVV